MAEKVPQTFANHTRFDPLYHFFAIPVFALARAKAKAQRIYCINNFKQVAVASKLYADDNSGRIPSAYPIYGGFSNTWCGGNAATVPR